MAETTTDTPVYVTLGDDGEVYTLILSDETGVFVRQAGEWAPLEDDLDPRVEGTEWVSVTPEFVEIYDGERLAGHELDADDVFNYRQD